MMTNRADDSRARTGWIAATVLALAACGTAPTAQSAGTVARPGRPGTPVEVRISPVALNSKDPLQGVASGTEIYETGSHADGRNFEPSGSFLNVELVIRLPPSSTITVTVKYSAPKSE